ncbi:glycoside hydrolase family 20 protein [Laccaria bicolor S238N-H82]|uniref:Glycoside hydrolase family 20 protein n=1 Tax=Laccaria bicolor (strain S238N-H82 / ATCC MYA-4686) TaxID=486041 RepID=B0CXC9_LACBS|nr:glycoside hydrolase family 20 protein [Laccaria bicolor S238N-H82]EDR13237.1 glycoside hydrolase family 20 protein [Laccaria bicolor S238N-H82]|eukprot:XP_001875735.1 glycoside hydrolase family 20 protein [Laccaria bicolor S238N-H82]
MSRQLRFKIIHAFSDYFYLDCGHAGQWVGDNGNGNSCCDPFNTWQKICLTDTQKGLMLGVWPCAALSVELFWSRPGGDVSNTLPQLHNVTYHFNQCGVSAIALQPEWCALRAGACDLFA